MSLFDCVLLVVKLRRAKCRSRERSTVFVSCQENSEEDSFDVEVGLLQLTEAVNYLDREKSQSKYFTSESQRFFPNGSTSRRAQSFA